MARKDDDHLLFLSLYQLEEQRSMQRMVLHEEMSAFSSLSYSKPSSPTKIWYKDAKVVKPDAEKLRNTKIKAACADSLW